MNRPSTARCPGGFDLKRVGRVLVARLFGREQGRRLADDIVPIAAAFDETGLRELLKRIRARWEPQIKMWFAPYRLVRGTPLEAKIAAARRHRKSYLYW